MKKSPRISRRLFLQGTAIGTGAAASGVLGMFPGVPSSATGVAHLGAPPNGLGYPGLPDAAVFGAELQYFRMSPDAIAPRLELCAQAHYGVIQSYVPWNVHEFAQGSFDFTGRTTPILPDDHLDEYQLEDPVSETEDGGIIGRFGLTANTNLERFLGQVAEGGYKMILRPGPFISDEWRNGGMPDWLLLEGDPDMFVVGPDGSTLTPGFPFSPPLGTVLGGSTLFYFPSPSYASEMYLDASRTWLEAFAAYLRDGKWLHTEGGPVVGLQVDDESCFFYRTGPFEVDYHPAMITRWLEYSGGIAPPRDWPSQGAGVDSLRDAFTWQRFKAGQVGAYLGALATDLRQGGMNVPINHELEQHMVPPADMVDDAQAIILNGEYYDSSDPWNLPVTEVIAQSIRAASRQRTPTYGTEMATGDAVLYNLLLGEGIFGGLQFTYTEGVEDGTLGALTPLGRAFEAAGPMLGSATRRADVAIVWDNTLVWAPFGSQRWGFSRDVRGVIEHHVPALLSLLIRAGYAVDFVDVHVAEPEDLAGYPTIFYAAADICPRGFQSLLVDYVTNGGRLVCWPAPPTLDENLDVCTVVLDALFPEPVAEHNGTDGIGIDLLGIAVPVWNGVDLYTLSPASQPIATLGRAVCGYARPAGAGIALLLGTWLAADSVPGRDGTIVESAPLPAGIDPVLALAQLAADQLGSALGDAVTGPLPGGTPQQLLLWTFPNQRRGGETISTAIVGYWDGENVVSVVGVNTDSEQTPVQTSYPYHPILPSHIQAIAALAGVAPQVQVANSHLQARILDGPVLGGATVALANRWPDEASVSVRTTVDGQAVQIPRQGTFSLPGSTALLLPIGYPLGPGRTLVQASAQLLGVLAGTNGLALGFLAPAGGEAVLAVERTPSAVSINGSSARFSVLSGARDGPVTLAVSLPAGESDLYLNLD